MSEGEASNRSCDEKVGQVEEVKRRLRLDGFPTVGVSVWLSPCAGYDVTVTIAPPNAQPAARVVDLCPDIAIKVKQGEWRRS